MFDQEEARVDLAVGAPAEGLMAYVERYVGFRAWGLTAGAHSALPCGYGNLAISFGPPVEMMHVVDGVERTDRFAACVAGLRDSAATVRYGAFRDAVYVNLKPMGIAALMGVAATELAGRTVALSEVIGNAAEALVERLSEAGEWAARFVILDEELQHLVRPQRAASQIAWAWAQLQRTRGQAGVQALAEEIGWSRRHFAERFREEIGLAPKTAARVLRFEHACLLMKRERPALAQLAAECGFHDQAHLTREWNLLAGCTPREWMRRELPFFQDFDLGSGDNAGDETGTLLKLAFQRRRRGGACVL